METFNTADSDPDVCGLDHGHVIRTVADGQKQRLQVSLHELDDQSFLQGRDTTRNSISIIFQREKRYLPANHSLAHDSKIKEKLLHVLLQGKGQGLSINDQCQCFDISSVGLALDSLHFFH